MEKFKKIMQIMCAVLEAMAAVLVLIGIVLSAVSILSDISMFRSLVTETSTFKFYLEEIFTIVIGIEFLAMLCRPNSDNVMEVLIFLVARHMIVGDTTAYEDFVSVISVALLCVLRRYLSDTRKKEKGKGTFDGENKKEILEEQAEKEVC
ncbi:MAG: hypothetical protein NC086_09470 [Alistipes sp.]|nr:hypothetical protein [Alistipes sp.]